jgi:hypothetical protein
MASDAVEATNLELWGLYNIQRSAYLNLLYYGARATIWARWNLWLQVGASVGALGAVTGFLTVGSDPLWKWVSALVGAASAVSAAIPSIMGHAEKVNKFEKLHFAWCEVFELAKRAAMDIRRAALITPEQYGETKLLNDICSRLGHIEDPDRKDTLAESCEARVRERFPDESFWYAGGNAEAGAAQTSTPAAS